MPKLSNLGAICSSRNCGNLMRHTAEVINVNPYALGIKGGVEVNLAYLTETLTNSGVKVANIVGYTPLAYENHPYNHHVDPFFNPINNTATGIDDGTVKLIKTSDNVHWHNLHTLEEHKLQILYETFGVDIAQGRITLHI